MKKLRPLFALAIALLLTKAQLEGLGEENLGYFTLGQYRAMSDKQLGWLPENIRDKVDELLKLHPAGVDADGIALSEL